MFTHLSSISPPKYHHKIHPKNRLTRGFLELNDLLHSCPGIDDTLSGTTAIALLFIGERMFICNVGDSRAILAQRASAAGGRKGGRKGNSTNPLGAISEGESVEGGPLYPTATANGENGTPSSLPPSSSSSSSSVLPQLIGGEAAAAAAAAVVGEEEVRAYPLSDDQTPYRKNERERVKKCGARVMSMDQIAGFEPIHEKWGDVKLGEAIDEAGDPPRVWSKYGKSSLPPSLPPSLPRFLLFWYE